MKVRKIKVAGVETKAIDITGQSQNIIALLGRIGFSKRVANWVCGNVEFVGEIDPVVILKSQIEARMREDRDALEDAADRLNCSKSLAFQYLAETTEIDLLLNIETATK